jgi:hypothetical protein
VYCSCWATFGQAQSSRIGCPLPKSRGALLPGGADSESGGGMTTRALGGGGDTIWGIGGGGISSLGKASPWQRCSASGELWLEGRHRVGEDNGWAVEDPGALAKPNRDRRWPLMGRWPRDGGSRPHATLWRSSSRGDFGLEAATIRLARCGLSGDGGWRLMTVPLRTVEWEGAVSRGTRERSSWWEQRTLLLRRDYAEDKLPRGGARGRRAKPWAPVGPWAAWR